MNQESGDIFSKVSPEEQKRLFKDLATARGEIVCKGDSDEIYHLIAERFMGQKEVHCSVPFGLSKPDKEKELICNFFLGGERYFFKSPVRRDHATVILHGDTELFHLQRRQNYRIRIPEKFQAQYLITSYNLSPVKLSGQILDLSSGGCRIALVAATPALEPDDKLKGHIAIGNRESLEVEGTVRHHKVEKSGTLIKQIFGLEFRPLSPQIEGKLFAITLDLHRQFFSRLNTKI